MRIDTSAAEAYETYMVPAFLGAWARKAVTVAAPQSGESVVDVTCGTGSGLRFAAERVGQGVSAVGVDIDPAMIEVAQRLAANCPVSTIWHCASADRIPLPDAAFDLCLCLQGLQFFPDRVAALAEMCRVLKPSGRLIATAWVSQEDAPAYDALIRALEQQHTDTAAIRKAFSFGDTEAIRSAARQAGFGSIEVRTDECIGSCASVQAYVDVMTAGSTVARSALAKLSSQGRAQLIQEMNAMLTAYIGNEFRWPMRARILIAQSER